MKKQALLLLGAVALTIVISHNVRADLVDPEPQQLREAQVMALDIDGQSLRPPADLTERLYSDLAAIRQAYPDIADITYFATAVPDEIIVRLTEAAYELYRSDQYHALDELNTEYGMTEMRQIGSSSPSFVLTFDQVYNTQMLADIYAQAEGLVYTQPNHYYGDGSTIEAAPPYYTFIRKWGDCPSGCIHSESWRFKVEDGQVISLDDRHWPPENVEIIPPNPTSADTVEIILSGQWPDSCIPTGSTALVSGENVFFDVLSNTAIMMPCALVVTPWRQSQTVGPLPSGTYNLYARHIAGAFWGPDWPQPTPDPSLYTLITQFEVTPAGQAATYIFDPEQSTVVQTGGFAGIHETYRIEGQFQLLTNPETAAAKFTAIDATLTHSPFLPTRDLGALFNMTGLQGSLITDTQMHFTGKTTDGLADVSIWLILTENAAHMTGQIDPPCCDFFNYHLNAVAFEEQPTYYVDAENGSDNNNGLTPETAFATIQKGLDVANDGSTVKVLPGRYLQFGPGPAEDNVAIADKNITLTSADPIDPDTVRETVIQGPVIFHGNEGPNCVLTGFTISDLADGGIHGSHTHATISHCVIIGNAPCNATVIKDCDGIISNCIIADNSGFMCSLVNPVVFGCHGLIRNCTIVNNHSGVGITEGGTTTIQNCIIYNNFSPQISLSNTCVVNISYCNVQGGMGEIHSSGTINWGPGNIDTDPHFVRWGHWQNGLTELTEGDYHLKTQAGRPGPGSGAWFSDNVTSRCIDAGNPGSALGDEQLPVAASSSYEAAANVRINMGAYGGTADASMAPQGWALLGDLTNDGFIDAIDYALQTDMWLHSNENLPGDLNRDGSVNALDVGLLVEDWLKATTWRQ